MCFYGGLLLIGGEIGDHAQQLIAQFCSRGRIQHDGDAGFLSPACHSEIDFQRNFQLQQHDVVCRDFVFDPGHFFQSQCLIGTGDDNDAVLRGVFRYLQSHMTHTGGDAFVYHNAADVYAGGSGSLQQFFTEEIVTHTAHHGDVCTESGTLQSLVSALAARGHMEFFSVNSLSGRGNAVCGGDDIHHKTAYN